MSRPDRGLLGHSGEVAAALAAVDWAATPLGPPEGWPRSLETAVGIVLTSRFPMWMGWGEDLTFFCNDAYRHDTLGVKFPWALGRPAREVWAEIWDDIGPRAEAVLATGTATWDEALLLFLERSGYVEETYHTFSYSPLPDDVGAIAGLLCVVREDTERVIADRRLATVRSLGSDPTAVRTEADVLAATARSLAANPRSLPFTLLYVLEDDEVRLAASTGVPDGHPLAVPTLPVDAAAPWAPALVLGGSAHLVEGLGARYPDLPTGAWQEPPTAAYVLPLPQQGSEQPFGFLVVGLNRYRPFDEGYAGFLELIAGQVAAAIGTARAYEAERSRAEALAALDLAKTQFFTNISHEFRTPLTLLLGPAEDALADGDGALPAEQHARLEVIRRNAQRLLKLVNSLLDFSRVESGRAQACFEPVDLGVATAELVAMFRSAFERAGLDLRVEVPAEPVTVHLDREMWAKVVLNLLSNALKFTFEGGVTVTVSPPDGDAVTVAVADTGIGIAPEERDRLFERFHRITGSQARTHEGSGIGLALVAQLVHLHGGEVSVRSEPADGTTFTVRLPLGTAHLPPEQVAAATPEGDDVAARTAEGFLAEALRWLEAGGVGEAGRAVPIDAPRVLVVDDNADMRDHIAGLLGAAYRVSVAADGAEALEVARRDLPDLVLTDVMMPRLDGFGLLAALRRDAATAGIPVVMLSARAGEDGVVEGLEAGADDYLAKPFSARELRARVRANLELDRSKRLRDALERSQELLAQAEQLAGVGSWELDLTTGAIIASSGFLRLVQLEEADLDQGLEHILERRVHPEDAPVVRDALDAGLRGEPIDFRCRLVFDDGSVRTFRTLGTLLPVEAGRPGVLRGSHQDITEQLRTEAAMAAALAEREAAQREHQIAEELQRSLLPELTFEPDHLEVATFYRAGDEGTQVGGDWYDVVELGAGRTALILGDVMGRGVRAAAVMGQLRSAIRAYCRLDLPPADVLDFVDRVVEELVPDHIVTCVYAVYDPADSSLSYASAGHVPPIVVPPGEAPHLLSSSGPPLGSGGPGYEGHHELLPLGTLVALYTDGLVERRDRDLDGGIALLVDALRRFEGPVGLVPAHLVAAVGMDNLSDDVAVLVARVGDTPPIEVVDLTLEPHQGSVRLARAATTEALAAVGGELVEEVTLAVSELVTNAILHGAPPVRMLLRVTERQVVLEVHDGTTVLPRRMRPGFDDEHGRGLQLVNAVADRWGTRTTTAGKAVWCAFQRRTPA